MVEVPATAREGAPAAVSHVSARRRRARWLSGARKGVKDVLAGAIAAVVLVANIVSFAALMFPGDLGGGVPLAIWAMLIGSAVGGLWIAWTTSLPPLATGIDSPTGVFLVQLGSGTAAAVTGAGGTAHTAIVTAMLVFTAATAVCGALLLLVGTLRWGGYFRFVPFFVVAGFLAATGWFLVVGGLRMTTGIAVGFDTLAQWPGVGLRKLMLAVVVLAVLLGVRRLWRSALGIPLALLAMWLATVAALHATGLSAPEHGWFLPSLGTLPHWEPFDSVRDMRITGAMVLELAPEFVAVALVALVSLVTKVATLEVARQAAGDLDREFRGHGIANLVVAPLGGIACSLQTGTSRLLEQAGGATRFSGVVSALVLGAVALAHLDLPRIVPVPIVAGLVFYLGYTFAMDAFARLWQRRAWKDFALALVITLVCIRYGYLVGVLAGLIGACVLFAFNYARLGVVRRHASRTAFASHVDRSHQAAEYLRLHGEAIQVYWLEGYIFFGSSESLFERVRGDLERLPRYTVRYVVLDFGRVPGADSSAVASLAKLRGLCKRHAATLVYASLSRKQRALLASGDLLAGPARDHAFTDLNDALAWCEDRVIAEGRADGDIDVAGFERWLADALDDAPAARDLIAYLERKDTGDAQVLYRQGDSADSVDLVARGHLVIELAGSDGTPRSVRRVMNHTVVGEMGFVRRTARSATVRATGPATVFTLTRTSYERMRRERPDLAVAFDAFIMRTMADRLDQTNRALTALGG